MDLLDLRAAEVVALVCRETRSAPNPAFFISDFEIDAAERDLGLRFPQSYRAFLHFFGGQSPPVAGIYGLPRANWDGDVVLLNCSMETRLPLGGLKFKECDQREYYFETLRMDCRGECPVSARNRDGKLFTVAADFVRFLCWEGARPLRLGSMEGRVRCANE